MGQRISAIVLAAGRGSRMESDIPKQFMLLSGKPVIYYALKAFDQSVVDDIILVTGENDIEYIKAEVVERYGISKVKSVVAGGKERFNSVKNGLLAATDSDFVLIHDGARPFVDGAMIDRMIEAVKQYGACTVGVPAKDTIKIVDSEMFGVETPDRNILWQIQTPQAFNVVELLKAYEKMEAAGDVSVTDDTMVMEKYGNKKSKVVMGDYKNIKITTPEDLKIAEIFVKN